MPVQICKTKFDKLLRFVHISFNHMAQCSPHMSRRSQIKMCILYSIFVTTNSYSPMRCYLKDDWANREEQLQLKQMVIITEYVSMSSTVGWNNPLKASVYLI